MNPDKAYFESLRIGRILTPIDFHPCTYRTLQFAGEIAQQFNAVICLLYVVQIYVNRDEETATGTTLSQTMRETVRKEMNRLAKIMLSGGITATVTIQEGCPPAVILQEAENLNADLIILGKRGSSRLSRLFRRDPLWQVVQQAQCPVISLPFETFKRTDSTRNNKNNNYTAKK